MTQQDLSHDYISAFLRDALRINASPWIVTNVMRIWLGHGVPAAAMLGALDDVLGEHPLDPQQMDVYRQAVVDLLAGRASIPSQRAGAPETHDVTIHCPACGEELLLDDDEAALVGDVASFTSTHATCPAFSVQTQIRLS